MAVELYYDHYHTIILYTLLPLTLPLQVVVMEKTSMQK